jgi:hypothetical protein
VIDDYLGGEDWDEPPEAMAFEAAYGDILSEVARLGPAVRDEGRSPAERARDAAVLYIAAPAIVNVALNYKICAEHDLPLHPTVYYELAEAKRYRMDHSLAKIDGANRLYRDSIELARAAYRLDEELPRLVEAFDSTLPEEIRRFVYTGGRDNYSWRGSEPEKLRALAAKVRAFGGSLGASPSEGSPFALLVACAHGAIMPALLLAEYLELPLYFIRFSMFKRKDEAPILSLSDEVWLSTWREATVLLFDEDVAKGTTLELFSRCLGPLFGSTRSACTIRHAGSSFAPDFVAKFWWD